MRSRATGTAPMFAELARLAIAPLFVSCVTLVARRLGPSAAGFLAALPVVAAPIIGLLVAAVTEPID